LKNGAFRVSSHRPASRRPSRAVFVYSTGQDRNDDTSEIKPTPGVSTTAGSGSASQRGGGEGRERERRERGERGRGERGESRERGEREQIGERKERGERGERERRMRERRERREREEREEAWSRSGSFSHVLSYQHNIIF